MRRATAVVLGYLLAEADIKEVWEAHALRGQKIARGLNEGARTENKRRSRAAEKKHQQWQAKADRLQKSNKWLTKITDRRNHRRQDWR